MAGRVLITGGAGFIGRHVARALLRRGEAVVLLDSSSSRCNAGAARADVLREGAELIEGDVRDLDTARALRGVDAVVHLAAEVGVGQSMYAIARYVGVNDLGTACSWRRSRVRPCAASSSPPR